MAAKILLALGLLVTVASACKSDWDNTCTGNWDCCSGNCKNPGTWATGVCQPGGSPPAGCKAEWDNTCTSNGDCCTNFCDKQPSWAQGVCKQGSSTPTNPGTGNPGSGGGLVSQDEFNNAVSSNGGTPGDKYSYYLAGLSRGSITTKLEAAMALAQFLHESGGLVYKREIVCDNGNNCPDSYRTPGCDAAGQYYFGRGYIQLSWCDNYRAAGQDLGLGDALVQEPDRVAREEQLAWDTAFSYWKRIVHNYNGVQQGQFGAATKAINNGPECQGANVDKSKRRFQIYQNVFSAFHLSGSPDERGCYN